MAWISGLADKAENILNKLDQNAATALTQVPPSDAIIDGMRKSLSSGALKALSPAKSNKPAVAARGINDVSRTTSRRSSIDSKADSVTLDLSAVENAFQTTSMSSSFTEPTELAAFKIALAEVSSERDDLRLRLSAANRDLESEGFKQRIHELEALTQCLNEERNNIQQEIQKLYTTNSAYIHTISELESNLAKLQQNYLETAEKLQMQMKENAQQRQDFQEYRIKAQHTLQVKDNLIVELKSSSGATLNDNDTHTNGDETKRVLQLESDAIRQELQHITNEKESLQTQLEELRQQWHDLTNEHAIRLNEMRENEATLHRELRLERERLSTNEAMHTRELQTLRQQYKQQLAIATASLQEKEQQLTEYRNTRPKQQLDAVGSLNDAESRIRTLTQALVDKQNSVEKMTAEKNAMRIQLEKLQEEKLHQVNYVGGNAGGANTPRSILLSNSTDDAKAQYPFLMVPNPFDNRVARRVKRAYSSLDSAGVRLGAFLRRYPLMRVFVLLYVAMLHLWVMFVLLSSMRESEKVVIGRQISK